MNNLPIKLICTDGPVISYIPVPILYDNDCPIKPKDNNENNE